MRVRVKRGSDAFARTAALLCISIAAACSVVAKNPSAIFQNVETGPGQILSREVALEDLEFLIRLVERVHPDPYRFHPREALETERRRVAERMPESLAKTDLCLRLSRVLAVLDDGHTRIPCINLIRSEWERASRTAPPETQRVLVFAPYIRLDDQQQLTVGWHNGVSGIDPGDRILRVNGQDAAALLAAWAPEISYDTDAGRRAQVAMRFRLYLALHGIDAPYRLTVAPPGGPARDVTIEGVAVNYQFQSGPPAPARPFVTEVNLPPVPPTVFKPIQLQNAFFEYRMIEPDIAYMNFFSIIDGLDSESQFHRAVDHMFTRVAADRPRVLIIDIRENGGGDDSAAEALLRHLTERRFRLLTSVQLKRSEETKAFVNSAIRVPFRWLGLPYLSSEMRQYYNGPAGTLSHPLERPLPQRPRAEPFFDGPVCVLTGPHTFSAAVEFAEAVKTFGLATIVGEDTGGQPNSFGNPFPFTLPRSKLSVSIATARSLRANGNLADFNPVTPDIVVRTTAADMRRGFDPVLERAKSCPPRSIR
jgi:hypothetical protein